ncbi:hypothetical protein EVAR_27827_1 [Eumeta japonica]|uniref:Uncharacterized protein n=1 Tax=Eumeta variegata TaxID=151549 RepID=A0A4C1VJ80_EUMVA|nr:hypothetical protein EVAR_27827_1 [Eumeta japonica]
MEIYNLCLTLLRNRRKKDREHKWWLPARGRLSVEQPPGGDDPINAAVTMSYKIAQHHGNLGGVLNLAVHGSLKDETNEKKVKSNNINSCDIDRRKKSDKPLNLQAIPKTFRYERERERKTYDKGGNAFLPVMCKSP